MTGHDWQPIDTAPRDGTKVELTSMDNGEPQEVWPMQWTAKARLWAMHSKLSGALLSTWSEEDVDGAPTHWRAARGGK